MESFTCCLWWFLLGALAGWLANWLLCRRCGGAEASHGATGATPMAVSTGDSRLTISESASPAPESALHRLINTRFYHEYHGETGSATAAAPVPIAAQTLVGAAPAAEAAITIDVTAARAAGLSIKGPDDLTVVEGIGPKIAELLRARGITTFVSLSGMSAAGLQAILDAAGPNFKLAVPLTWPEQAALAAQNRWVELKALQDKLTAGVGPVD